MKAGAKRLYFDGGKLQIIHPPFLGWIISFDELRDDIIPVMLNIFQHLLFWILKHVQGLSRAERGNDRTRWIFLLQLPPLGLHSEFLG